MLSLDSGLSGTNSRVPFSRGPVDNWLWAEGRQRALPAAAKDQGSIPTIHTTAYSCL